MGTAIVIALGLGFTQQSQISSNFSEKVSAFNAFSALFIVDLAIFEISWLAKRSHRRF